MELPGRASHRDAFAASLLTSTFASLHIHSMSQNERVGRRGQVTSSNLHNLCMVTSSSSPGCERHYPPPLPPPSQSVYHCCRLISVAVRANKMALESSSATWAARVGHTGSGGRPANCISPSCLCPPSLPACPLAINATLSYPPHTHMTNGSFCAHTLTHTHTHAQTCILAAADAKRYQCN